MPHTIPHTHTFSLFVPISTRTRDPTKNICMWGRGLAESDVVTFFAVLQFHGSQMTKQLEIFEFFRADSLCYIQGVF